MTAVQFDNSREESADAYVFALPHTALASLLPQEIKSANPALASLDKIKVSPITGVHFWFDRPVTTEPFITLLDTTVQWVFNKTALYHPAETSFRGPGLPEESAFSSGQYLQLVISASYDLLKKSREEIIDLCLKEIRQALPAAREAQLVKATVIKEASATFSPEPGVDRFRPAQTTNTPGLFLAGDWTATGWPATMEGAVRSGYLAAEAVLRSVGSPAQFLQPDLAPTGLSKFFT
jgi:zeta-carotene desaturase